MEFEDTNTITQVLPNGSIIETEVRGITEEECKAQCRSESGDNAEAVLDDGSCICECKEGYGYTYESEGCINCYTWCKENNEFTKFTFNLGK